MEEKLGVKIPRVNGFGVKKPYTGLRRFDLEQNHLFRNRECPRKVGLTDGKNYLGRPLETKPLDLG